MAKYVAKIDGFVNGKRIRAGQTFEYEGKKGKWMLTVEEAGAASAKQKKSEVKEPKTLSEVARQSAGGPVGTQSNREVI